jgi:hypothetical protein
MGNKENSIMEDNLRPYKGKITRDKEYSIWSAMKDRCYNPNNPRYKDWGGRGIKVCDRWRNSYINFITDLGTRLENTSLDRINIDGNYEPTNCRWATPAEQAKNRRTSLYYKVDYIWDTGDIQSYA